MLSSIALSCGPSKMFLCADHFCIFALSESNGQIDMGRSQESPEKWISHG